MDFVGPVVMVIAAIVLFIWAIPIIIAFKRNHTNKWLITVFTVVFALFPMFLVSFIGWLICLAFALYKSPSETYVPLSKKGMVKDRGEKE